MSLPIAGRTAGWARANLREVLNLPYYAEALLNGSPVVEGHPLRGGDSLEYLQWFGFKGSDSEPLEVIKARWLLRRYPELTLLGAEVKAMGLDADEAVDLALASVVRFLRRRFGPVPGSEAGTLRAIAEAVTRIEDRQGPDLRERGPYRKWEAARLLGVSERTINRWAASGTLKVFKKGRVFLIERSEIDRLLRKHTR